MDLAFIFSIRSSSTQPPETEPTTWPSSRIATMAPIGRGAEPQVFTMVPSATRRPALRQSSAVRRTSISTLSMGKFYLNPASRPARAFPDLQRGAVRRRDFTHDGESQAAAGARRAGYAVEPLHNAVALAGGNAGPVIFDFDDRQVFPADLATRAPSRAHRDVAAARQILARLVHQIAERFAPQKHIAMHAGGLELEAQIEIAIQRAVHPLVGRAFDELPEIDLRRRLDAAAGLRAGKREQLVREARGAYRGAVHLLDLGACRVGDRLREGELGVRLQPGERRAPLVRGIGKGARRVSTRLLGLDWQAAH